MDEHGIPARTPINPLSERVLRADQWEQERASIWSLAEQVDRTPTTGTPHRRLDPLDCALVSSL